MWLSVKMHAAVPGSELLVLPGGSHVGPLEHPELCSLRVEKFFTDHFRGGVEPAESVR
jgi:pimeloyl-ACP methyl ester carboxylesterase